MDKIKQGDKFGRWTVNYCLNKNNKKYCNCTCDCGTNRDVRQENLLDGRSKSCGCLNREISSKINTESFIPNDIIVHDDYIEIILSNYSERTCLIDKEDYEKIKNYKWTYNKKRNCIRANNRIPKSKGTIKIHTLIMNCPKNLKVDHINHDIFDNRKRKLRICTNKENQWNKDKPKNNTSGHKGVYEDKTRPRFQAYIMTNGKRKLKSFPYNENNKEEVYKLACEWQENEDKKLRKEFSYYNSVIDNSQ